jgi:PadR family transcriptional regulator PadR
MNKTKDKKSELLPGTLEMLILKTLEHGGVMHGFGIAQHIKQISEEVLQVEEGSLYPALQRMQLKGWLASDWGHSANNRRARYYRLTATGRKQIQQEIAEFDRLLKAIQLVLQTT